MEVYKMKKLIVSLLIAVSALALNPVGANAEWQEDNYGWWYSEGNSYAIGLRDINGSTYYFDSYGYMKTGWLEDNYYGTWRFFYPNGAMAYNTVINGYELDQDGTWIKPSKEAEEVRNSILKEDSEFISKHAANNVKLTKSYIEGNMTKFIANEMWKVPEEEVYVFSLVDSYNLEYCAYLVGKNSKNIYCVPHQGGLSVYQIKDNKIIKTYKWLGNDGSSKEWR
jgi:hypothetical protein